MKLAEKCCGRCALWLPIDKRKFLGLCGQREPSDTTDRHESCPEFEVADEGLGWAA